MQNKKFSIGPTRLTNAAANYLNPPAASGGVGLVSATYALVSQITLVSTGAATTVSLYKGVTAGSAGGTEIIPPATVVPVAPAEVVFNFYPPLRFESADFLSGLAGTTNIVNIIIAGETGVTG